MRCTITDRLIFTPLKRELHCCRRCRTHKYHSIKKGLCPPWPCTEGIALIFSFSDVYSVFICKVYYLFALFLCILYRAVCSSAFALNTAYNKVWPVNDTPIADLDSRLQERYWNQYEKTRNRTRPDTLRSAECPAFSIQSFFCAVLRYSAGNKPVLFRNILANRPELLYPTAAAICSIVKSVNVSKVSACLNLLCWIYSVMEVP